MSEYDAIRDVFQDQMDTPEYKQLFYTAVLDAAQPVFNDAMTARAEAEQLRTENAALEQQNETLREQLEQIADSPDKTGSQLAWWARDILEQTAR
jgi:cell division protein FtsB